MAGDTYCIRVASGWSSGSAATNSKTNVLTDLFSLLSGGLASASGGKATQVQLQNSSSGLNTGLTNFLATQTTSGTKPKAYINWILFDEQFKIVTSNSGFELVGASGSAIIHYKPNLTVNKNGYLYIYTSNDATNIDVFFDNLQITHIRGPILEETHYYPFGLSMSGISSKALNFGQPENKKKYQQYEFNSDFDINLYESFYRTHDPQLGRFLQIDPKSIDSESPYVALGNNPIINIDILGNRDTSFYNEKGEKFATDNSKKNDVTYVIRTTQTTTQLYGSATNADGFSSPITSKEAKRAELFLSEVCLWKESDPALIKTAIKYFKNQIVKIKSSDQMDAAKAIVLKDDGTGGTKNDNNREYGGNFTNLGASALAPGAVTHPGSGRSATISNPNGEIDFHSHPSGTQRITLAGGSGATVSWVQPPSRNDIKTTAGRTEYVFGRGSGIIYVYDRKGVIATFPHNTNFNQ